MTFRDEVQRLEDQLDAGLVGLVTGPAGSGKTHLAREVWSRIKARRKAEGVDVGDFVVVDCGAIPEHLIESELFGHVRGAFSGATGSRKGLLRRAAGGCLFLDEIGDLPPSGQTRLLRFLSEGVVRPVGDSREYAVACTVVAATWRELRAEVEAGRFRRDLYTRLAHGARLRIPTINKTPERLRAIVEQLGGGRLGDLDVEALVGEDWRGGELRALAGVIKRALMSDPPQLGRELRAWRAERDSWGEPAAAAAGVMPPHIAQSLARLRAIEAPSGPEGWLTPADVAAALPGGASTRRRHLLWLSRRGFLEAVGAAQARLYRLTVLTPPESACERGERSAA